MSKVTVIISSYNYARFLPKCLDSILSQTRKADQIVVIDDHSTDNTSQVVKKYKKKITYVKHKKGIGNLKTYNEGIKIAKCDYIIFLNADDWIGPTLLEKESAIFDNNPQVGLVYSQSITVKDGVEKLIMPKPAGMSSYIGRKKDFYLFLTEGNLVPGNTALVRKNVFEKLGTFDINLVTTADHEMWMRITKSYPIAYIAEPLAYYRIHSKNMHQKKGFQKKMIREYRLILDKYLKDPSIPKSVADYAKYRYFVGAANKTALTGDFTETIHFWLKAVRILPSSIIQWSTWQPFYFYIRESLSGRSKQFY